MFVVRFELGQGEGWLTITGKDGHQIQEMKRLYRLLDMGRRRAGGLGSLTAVP